MPCNQHPCFVTRSLSTLSAQFLFFLFPLLLTLYPLLLHLSLIHNFFSLSPANMPGVLSTVAQLQLWFDCDRRISSWGAKEIFCFFPGKPFVTPGWENAIHCTWRERKEGREREGREGGREREKIGYKVCWGRQEIVTGNYSIDKEMQFFSTQPQKWWTCFVCVIM